MMLGMAMQDKRVTGVRPVSLEDAPQLNVDVDQDKARALGLDIGQINQTISAAWGGAYVNDFIDRGRVKRVYVQADEPYRQRPEDVQDLYVRGQDGQSMAPFTAFSTLKWANAPVQLSRYNGLPSLANPGLAGAGRQQRHRDQGDGGDAGQAAARNRPAMDRPVLRGAAVERPGARALRPVAADRLPLPRGALRKLDDPARGDPGRAARHRRGRCSAPSSPASTTTSTCRSA